jgi:hypothetical protein
MNRRFSLTIPAGTTEDDPAEEVCQLSRGTITGGFIRFPPGPSGLVHLTVYLYEQQIYPLNRGGSYIGDGTDVSLGGRVLLVNPPYAVKLRGWGAEATLDHTVYVEFEVEEPALTIFSSPIPAALPEGFEE